MKLFTIGFTKKPASTFFDLLKNNNVKTVIDIRLNNYSQLAGFAKGNDLKYFLKEICNIDYTHNIDLAPTKEILDNYKTKKIIWSEYVDQFTDLLENRYMAEYISKNISEFENACLLCSELKPDKCHRSLVAEYIKKSYQESNFEIKHL
ncbi:hypothetical protein BHU72_00965 [Desulfuribacillus stibiiarsenatis]|uniref:DUF488 domain-containing protein n=1 Tax=Desulfuribacillus stibiiarsenatis TaxID=1390249 RepID=A0A1E5L9Q1_9FIRM|nr:DUF488 domain-containing protein [Desulfuribacillus stibiiarsenatis]OEH86866.1 hypothetical protein BHU72_00965 [Desulfuribacillus stibiiarsenatis]